MKSLTDANPMGLFQTTYPVGFIFAVIKDKNEAHQFIPVPCHNNCRGEEVALDLMKSPDFICWAIDPWSGKINIKIGD